MLETKIFAGGGMDNDSAIEYMDKVDYLSAFNVRNTGTERQELGYITSVEGTIEIPYLLPLGINKCIGAKAFKNRRKAYAFIYNSQLEHLVLEYDFDANTLTKVFQNKIDSDGEDILILNPDNYVEDINLIGEELYFLPSNRVPSKLNLEKIKEGYYGIVRAEDISVIKAKPTNIITYRYYNDIGRTTNLIENNLIKFSTQYLYGDNQNSVFAELSKVYVPEVVNLQNVSGENNSIIINVDIGNDRVKTVIIGAKFNNDEVWKEVKRVDRDKLLTLPSGEVDTVANIPEVLNGNTYSFIFYNDGLYVPIDVFDTDLEYDRVPKTAQAQAALNGNILSYGNLTEGFDPINIDIECSVSYSKKFDLAPTISTNPLEIYKIEYSGNIFFWSMYYYFRGNPVVGDVISIVLRHRTNGQTITSSITVTSAEAGNLELLLNTFGATGGFTGGFTVVNEGSGNYRFQFYAPVFYEPFITRIDLADLGSEEFQSQSAIKLNSSRQYGIMYEYPYGRLGNILTNQNLVVPTDAYATTLGNSPVVQLTLNHTPPEDAIGYYIVSSGQTTHLNTVYMAGVLIDPANFNDTLTYSKGDFVVFDGDVYRSIANNNTVNPTDESKWSIIGSLDSFFNADYLAFDMTSFKRFNEVNKSSVLNYEYTKGDRASVIFYRDGTEDKYFNTSPIDVQVTGFEYDLVGGDVNNPNTGLILKIQKSNIDTAIIKDKYVFFEVYTPKKSSEETNLFYTIGERYDIVDGEHSVTSISIDRGEVYYKTRKYQLPTDLDETRFFLVEDFNYSDFADTRVDDLGRGYLYNKEARELTLESAIRHSDIFNEASNLNLLNRFKTENIYGNVSGQTTDLYGGIYKMRQRGSSLLIFQENEIGYVPVNTTIYEDVTGQSNVAVSDKLLNNIRYNGNGIGIGRATKSFAEDSGDYYFVDPNKSEPYKADAGGIRSIAGKMAKFFRDTLQSLTNTKRSYIGFYNSFYKEYILTAELESGVVIEATFDTGNWKGDTYTVLPTDITANQPVNGNVTYNTLTGIATYTPDTDYTGADPFTFEFDGITRNVCLAVEAGDVTVNLFFFLDLIDQPLNTLIVSNAILVDGINIPVPISIVGGEYEINGSGIWLTAPSTVVNGDSVRVRQTSSTSLDTTTDTVLTISGTSDTFSVKTISSAGSGNVSVSNVSLDYTIISVTNITGFTLPNPLDFGEEFTGTHSDTGGIINVNVNFTGVINTSELNLYINGIIIDAVSVTNSGIYTLNSGTILVTDDIEIILGNP